MRHRMGMLLAIVSTGCASAGAPSLQVNGYARIPTPTGCYEHVSQRDRNVQLTPELERYLIGLLKSPTPDARCWYERPDRRIEVSLGDECGPHQVAVFHREGEAWGLLETRDQPLVICDRRKQ